MLQEVTNRGYRQSISNVDAVNNKLNGQPSKSALELDYIGWSTIDGLGRIFISAYEISGEIFG